MSKAFSDFDIDRTYGESREGSVRAIIDGTIEVKSDRKAIGTGNFFLEFEQYGNPSGIAVTKADWWFIEYAPDKWIVMRPEELKRIGSAVAETRASMGWKPYTQGGDGNNFKGVLIPLSRLLCA